MINKRLFVSAATALSLIGAGTVPVLAVGTQTTVTPSQAAYVKAEKQIRRKQYSGAIVTLAALVKKEPSNADAWNLLGFASRKNGDLDPAEKYYKTALKLNPGHLGALEYQGELFVETGRITKAKANLDRLKSLCGNCEEYRDLRKAVRKAESS